MTNGRALSPSTQQDPLLRFLFREQERLQLSTLTLAKLSGVDKHQIARLRRPESNSGKQPKLWQVRALAHALDFRFPETLEKNE